MIEASPPLVLFLRFMGCPISGPLCGAKDTGWELRAMTLALKEKILRNSETKSIEYEIRTDKKKAEEAAAKIKFWELALAQASHSTSNLLQLKT